MLLHSMLSYSSARLAVEELLNRVFLTESACRPKTAMAELLPDFIDTPPPDSCIFCRLVNGEIPSAKVYEDDSTIAFLDLGQVNPGHVLIAVKRHAATLIDITPEEAAAAMKMMALLYLGPAKTLLPLNLEKLHKEFGRRLESHESNSSNDRTVRIGPTSGSFQNRAVVRVTELPN
ncbi:HIT family protein [Ferribacterium limneticum]|uniref:HIT family protein n=1 Tax=Ferribacterium limneticum TaxID=76259 RepID=UPI001CFBBF88|nr:HIT domain-containing protein [Ferribacterium limneticum]